MNVVSNCKWDTRQLGIEYNSYVDTLLKELQTFGRKLVRVQKTYGFPDRVSDKKQSKSKQEIRKREERRMRGEKGKEKKVLEKGEKMSARKYVNIISYI